MKMNKKGMEFSVNAVVGIVLGLFMFITGMTIFYNIYSGISETPMELDERMRQEIFDRMSPGSKIFIPETGKTMDRNGQAIYYVAISNLESEHGTFRIEAENLTANLTADAFGSIELDPNERHVFLVRLDGRNMQDQQGRAQIDIKTESETYATRIIYLNR